MSVLSSYPAVQHTIKQSVTVTDIGLHSGQPVTLTLHPADCGHGIVFRRTDIAGQPCIPADAMLVNDTLMSSNLVKYGVKIGTVEHLLSAVAGMGLDNLLIDVSAPEVPIMDGSASGYIGLIEQAGIQPQDKPREYLKITQAVHIEDGDKWVELLPFDGFELNFEIKFNHPAIEQTIQKSSVQLTPDNYKAQVAQARTFGFLQEIEQLKQHNLALGGSLDNAIVLDDAGVMNADGLRSPDEFVKHKILDAVGDLYLIGYPLLAQYNAYKSGHALNNQLVKAVLNDPKSFEIVTIYDM